jgi:hypothetical protein
MRHLKVGKERVGHLGVVVLRGMHQHRADGFRPLRVAELNSRMALRIGAAFMKFGRAPTTMRIFIARMIPSFPVWTFAKVDPTNLSKQRYTGEVVQSLRARMPTAT